eukprot:3028609-Rhodomonas_salina.4
MSIPDIRQHHSPYPIPVPTIPPPYALTQYHTTHPTPAPTQHPSTHRASAITHTAASLTCPSPLPLAPAVHTCPELKGSLLRRFASLSLPLALAPLPRSLPLALLYWRE